MHAGNRFVSPVATTQPCWPFLTSLLDLWGWHSNEACRSGFLSRLGFKKCLQCQCKSCWLATFSGKQLWCFVFSISSIFTPKCLQYRCEPHLSLCFEHVYFWAKYLCLPLSFSLHSAGLTWRVFYFRKKAKHKKELYGSCLNGQMKTTPESRIACSSSTYD